MDARRSQSPRRVRDITVSRSGASRPQSDSAATGKYGKESRILKRRDFEQIQETGQKLYTRSFLIAVREGETKQSRLGITVSKKVSAKATDRNLIKRRVREFFRRNRSLLVRPLDIIVIARRDAEKCALRDIARTILGALGKNGLLVDRE